MNITAPKTLKEKKEETAKRIVLAFVGVALVGVLMFTGILKQGYNALFVKPTPTPDPRALAVEAGVTASLTFEYKGDYDTWLTNICSISTEVYCQVAKVTYGPGMQKAANDSQKSSTVSNVHAITMVDETQEGAADHQQIWAVAYTYDNWNGTKDTYDYFMITEVDGVWKFDGSLLIPQKMLDQAYSAKLTPQPTTQPQE
jgi:hypothetical protein